MNHNNEVLEHASIRQYCKVVRTPAVAANFLPLSEQAAKEQHSHIRYLEDPQNPYDGIDHWFDPQYSTRMNVRLTIDKAGRVVIPKPLRGELHLEPGDSLDMESAGEQITLRPVRGTGPLTKEHGVWVFHSGQPLPASATDDMLQQIREERDMGNLGKGE